MDFNAIPTSLLTHKELCYNDFMDIIRIKKEIKPNLTEPDPIAPEPKREISKKIWIITSLIFFFVFILIMAKLFIVDSISSKQELFSEIDPVAEKFANELANSYSAKSQPSSNIPKANTAAKAPDPIPASETQLENQSQEDTASKTEKDTAEELTAAPSQGDKFISNSPVNISEITKISKFRSCANEAYGKTSFQDQEEPKSSLKHYFNLKDSGISVYAPFDGEIIRKNSNSLVIETRKFNGWLMDISKINPENSLDQGSQVKAGDKIGKSLNNDLEIAILGFVKSQKEANYEDYSKQNLDSFFSHLNDSMSNEFSSKGAKIDLIIVSKSDRDNKKCEFKSANDEDWITLE